MSVVSRFLSLVAWLTVAFVLGVLTAEFCPAVKKFLRQHNDVSKVTPVDPSCPCGTR